MQAEWEIEEKKPSKEWPAAGVVEFQKYETRYRPELEPVLKGISMRVNAGEKVRCISII